jgi:DNA-binding transcriptional regulator YiaG
METLANQLGVTRQAVSQWEKGTTTPTGPARRLLSQILGLPLDTIDAWFAREEKAA